MHDWGKNLKIIEQQISEYSTSYENYLKEKYSTYDYIIIFGFGNIGLITAKELINHGINVHYFCDNDEQKVGKKYMEISCISVDKLNSIKDQSMIIICTRYYKNIYQQLMEMDVKNIDRVFINKMELIEKFIKFPKEQVINKITKVTELLEDERSKDVYTTILKNWLTLDYCQEEIDSVYTDDQYFCKDIFLCNDDEYFIDGGAYDGDTFEIFFQQTKGQFLGAHLFELSKKNHDKLLKNMQTYDESVRKKVHCINKGLSLKNETIQYRDDDEGSAIDTIGEAKGYLTSIDEACTDIPVTYIKMDIEGSEMQALKGAEKTIRQRKAKLAICLYHKFEDFWEIPLYLHQLMPEYKLYIRHHTDLLNETVCYAIT